MRTQLGWLILAFWAAGSSADEAPPEETPSTPEATVEEVIELPKRTSYHSHRLTDLPPALPTVTTHHFFPSHHEAKFPIGRTLTMLCLFYHNGSTPLNVTGIQGSLNSPFDFNFYLQNYSYQPVGTEVLPSAEFTFSYNFNIDENNAEKVDHQMAVTLFYHDEEHYVYSSTCFNGTVTLHSDSAWDKTQDATETLFITALIAAVVLAIVYSKAVGDWFFGVTSDQQSGKKGGKAELVEEVDVDEDDDWSVVTGPASGGGASGKGKAVKRSKGKKKST